MTRINRLLPVLLLSEGALIKTRRFKDARYLGDPVNAVRILNEKEVDELVILDTDPCRGKGGVNYQLLTDLASEAFMPVAYGGGIRTAADAARVISLGIEKVILNTGTDAVPTLTEEVSGELGSQAVVASIDHKHRNLFARGQTTFVAGGRRSTGLTPLDHASKAALAGAGEILLTAVDRDGCMSGYDLSTLASIASSVSVPVTACGGAGGLEHCAEAIHAGASAAAGGSMFMFHGRNRGILVTYPRRDDWRRALEKAY